MNKKISALFFTILVLLTFSICYADDLNRLVLTRESAIKVQLDGNFLDFTDSNGDKVEPQLINNRTMVPLRKIFESLDCDVDWNQETKTITALSNEREIVLTIDNEIAYLKEESGDKKEIKLDSAPVIVDNRTLVPVRFIAESLEKEVDWDQNNKTVVIIDNEKLLENLKKSVPALEAVFNLNLDNYKTFKTSSTIKANLEYKDADDKSNNEKVILKGNANTKFNEDSAEIDIKAEFSGTQGSLMKAIEDGNLKKINYKLIIKDGKVYLGKVSGKDYEWEEANLDETYLSILAMASQCKIYNYEDLNSFIKNSFETVDINTYSQINECYSTLGKIFSNENIKVTNNKNKTNLLMKLNLDDIANDIFSLEDGNNFALKMNTTIELELNKGIPLAEKIKLDYTYNALDSNEAMTVSAELESKISNVNDEIIIELPNL